MDNLIKKIPLPMSGLMLALAATGNLLSPYGAVYRYAFGIMAGILLVLLAAKAAFDPASLKEGFENPAIASTLSTFSMGMMLLSVYVKGFLPIAALGIWIAGLLLHFILMVLFTKKYIFSFNIKKVFPSYFIVYVGIVCGSITAPAFGLAALGRYIFWFGLAAYLLLLPVVLYRIIRVKEIPEPALPLNVILTAPSSLCLAGYLNSFPDKSMVAVALLCFLSLFMLILVISWMPKLLKLKFYPSYSAFTFPLVITAIAMKGANWHLVKGGFETGHLAKLISVLEVGSIAMVVYVLARYILFLSGAVKNK